MFDVFLSIGILFAWLEYWGTDLPWVTRRMYPVNL